MLEDKKYQEDIYNIELAIREKERQILKLKKKREEITQEHELWLKRGK